MIKTEIAGTIKALISSFCLYVLSMDAEFIMSVVAFVVILISNYARFKLQVKTWYNKIKRRFKR